MVWVWINIIISQPVKAAGQQASQPNREPARDSPKQSMQSRQGETNPIFSQPEQA